MYVSCIVSLLFSCSVFYVSCADTKDIANKSTESYSGKTLLDMGVRFNKPLLRLIGKSLMNLECNHHPCTAWAQWSPCKLFIGQYGMKTRTRQCGVTKIGDCGSESRNMQGKQADVCQEFCPSDYEMTKEGFCLKFYNSTGKTKADAEEICNKDGGYLININSEKKFESFSKLMQRNKYTSEVHINGQRADTSSAWTFTYEEYIRGFTKWAPGEPDNGSNELCMFAAPLGLYDVSCSNKYFYVCEVVPV